MIELVVFDMAGTTIDEDNVVYKTVQAAINAAGYDVTLVDVQAAGAGKEKSQAIRDVLSHLGYTIDESELSAIFKNFKIRLFRAYEDLDVREQSGAGEVFALLRDQGIKVALNTGYDRETAERLVSRLRWRVGPTVDAIVTASDVERGRPHPDMIHEIMRRVGVARSETVVKVGDSQIDIEEGRNAGCGMTFGITTGAQTREQLLAAHPTGILDALHELPSKLGR